MNLVVDRIVNEIIVCQDLETKMMFELESKSLDFKVNDGDVITLVNGKYVLNNDLKKERVNIIKEKINKAKNN